MGESSQANFLRLAEALHRSRQPWPAGGRAFDDDDGAASSDLPAEKST
jgi:hypothetical protein